MAEALWYSAPGQAEIRQEALAPPAADEVRVRALFGAVSRGTEALVLAGRVPVSEFERMRAPFMAGNFPFPVKYGYATVGRIEGGAEALRGRTVFTLHPHQNFFNIPASAAVVLPENLPPQRAVLAANMETALNAVWDAAPGPGRPHRRRRGRRGRLAGCVFVRAASRRGGHARRHQPGARGIGASPWGWLCKARMRPKATATSWFTPAAIRRGLTTALALAGEEATVLEMSWYGDAPVTAPLGGAFHSRRLRLISSQVGQIAPSHRPRWSHAPTARRRTCPADRCTSRRAAGTAGFVSAIWRGGFPIFLTPGMAYSASPLLIA